MLYLLWITCGDEWVKCVEKKKILPNCCERIEWRNDAMRCTQVGESKSVRLYLFQKSIWSLIRLIRKYFMSLTSCTSTSVAHATPTSIYIFFFLFWPLFIVHFFIHFVRRFTPAPCNGHRVFAMERNSERGDGVCMCVWFSKWARNARETFGNAPHAPMKCIEWCVPCASQHVNDSRKTDSILKAIRRRNVCICTFSHRLVSSPCEREGECRCRMGGARDVPNINCLSICLHTLCVSPLFIWNALTRIPLAVQRCHLQRSAQYIRFETFSSVRRGSEIRRPATSTEALAHFSNERNRNWWDGENGPATAKWDWPVHSLIGN